MTSTANYKNSLAFVKKSQEHQKWKLRILPPFSLIFANESLAILWAMRVQFASLIIPNFAIEDKTKLNTSILIDFRCKLNFLLFQTLLSLYQL